MKEAGVTTGAFYKYYPTKEALFAGLVDPCVQDIYRMYDDNYARFTEQGLADQTANLNENADSLTEQLVGYMYEHHDIMKLVLTASEGTPYASFEHELAVREAKSTMAFADLLRANGHEVPDLDEEFVHMVASGMFSAIFEIVLHDMDRAQAIRRIKLLESFYTAGWEKILGVRF